MSIHKRCEHIKAELRSYSGKLHELALIFKKVLLVKDFKDLRILKKLCSIMTAKFCAFLVALCLIAFIIAEGESKSRCITRYTPEKCSRRVRNFPWRLECLLNTLIGTAYMIPPCQYGIKGRDDYILMRQNKLASWSTTRKGELISVWLEDRIVLQYYCYCFNHV